MVRPNVESELFIIVLGKTEAPTSKTVFTNEFLSIPGLVVECQEDRSQIKNRQIAIQKLKMRLNERMQQEHASKIRGSRKSQVGTSARSDKVRTYNFPQDRITDHRVAVTIHNIPGFLSGEELLDNLIQKLIAQSEEDRINNFVQSIKENKV